VSAVRLTPVGGPTVLIEAEGWRILTDPTFDPPGGTYPFGLGTSSRKLSGPALSAGDVGPVDVALVSHAHHGDNLDAAGRALLAGVGTVITTTAAARDLGGGAVGLVPWATTPVEAPGRPTIEVTATPCRHGPPLSRPIVGDVIGFALSWEGQTEGELWISGDTVLYDGVRRVADRLDVDLAILHLGAVRFGLTGPVRYSMTAQDAVELCHLLRPRHAVPVHYEGWSHFSQGREGIARALAAADDDTRARFRMVPLGTLAEFMM
jgi:L-ascorbate metabolism protein UlaG (beta-lactamase superfamily)